jgi:glycosyltransferase involved in cell wall biosynthesis
LVLVANEAPQPTPLPLAAQGENSAGPTVSVIVPTYNRSERLRRLLLGLAREHAAGARFEVIISVDGSSDSTAEMLAALELAYSCHVLWHENVGPAAARNLAIRAAKGDVLLFLDDDVVPDSGLIRRHLEIHRERPDAVVMGPMLAPAKGLSAWLRWEAEMLQKQYNAMAAGTYRATARQFYTANASVRRQHVLAAGGFDERLRRAEDVELAYRLSQAGLGFHFLRSASVLHEPDRSFDSWLRVGYEYGRQDVVMTRSCGHTDVLARAYREWPERNAISRLFIRSCVGHRLRLRVATGLLRALVSAHSPAPAKLQMLFCSGLFNLHYWQGIADESGLGTAVWRPLPPA